MENYHSPFVSNHLLSIYNTSVMVNESSEQLNILNPENTHSNLITGDLIYQGIDGETQIFDGTLDGMPVIIKKAAIDLAIPMIQREYNFLLNPPIQPIEEKFQTYGIPLENWTVLTRLVEPIKEAVTPEMYKKGQIVLEKVIGKPLVTPSQYCDEYITNTSIPIKFQFGAMMGYLQMMILLNNANIALDPNFDTDLLIMPDVLQKKLYVVRIDCMPTPGMANESSAFNTPNTDKWRRLRPNGTFNYHQLAVQRFVESIKRLYPQNNTWSFLGNFIPSLHASFQNGDIYDANTLFDRFKKGLPHVDWDDEYVKEGDRNRLYRWLGTGLD